MTTFFSNDSLKIGSMITSGGKTNCIYDKEGNPGLYYQLIRFNIEDVDPTRVYISSASDSVGDVVFTTASEHRFSSGWPITIYTGSYAGTYKLVDATPGTTTFKIATYANWMSGGANVQRVAGYAATAPSYCGMFGTSNYPAFQWGVSPTMNVLNLSCFQNVVVSSTNSVELPVSFPNMSLWLAEDDRLTFNEWREISKEKGSGFHMITNWEYCAALLSAYAIRGKVQTNLLRGNTNFGRSHVEGYKHEVGRRGAADAYMGNISVEDPGRGDHTFSGTGPNSWNHNNSSVGIADLVGNMSEPVDGISIYKGQIYINKYNNHIINDPDNFGDSDWLATGVYFDSSADGSDNGVRNVVSAPILRYKSTFTTPAKSTYKLNNWTDDDTTLGSDDDILTDMARSKCASIVYDTTTVGAKYTDAPLATQQLLLQALIDLSWLDSSVVTDGYVAVKNSGTRGLLRGGHFTNALLHDGSSAHANMFTYSFAYGKETPFGSATVRTSFS